MSIDPPRVLISTSIKNLVKKKLNRKILTFFLKGIYDSNTSNEIGISVADTTCYKIKLYQFMDDWSNRKLFSKINAINPTEVIA